MQLVIPQLLLIATPANLFVSRMRAENKSGGTEVERMLEGQRWLTQREGSRKIHSV